MATRISDATRQACAAAWDDILALVAAGSTVQDSCAAFELKPNWLWAYRQGDAGLTAAWWDAQKEACSPLMDEHLATLRNSDIDPKRARVILNGLEWQLEKRDPERFAQRTRSDINVKTLDYSAILARAEARLAQQRAPALIDGRTGALLPDNADIALETVLSDAAKSLF